MNHLTRASLRHHGRRYVATGFGVAVAVAFVVTTFMFGQGIGSLIQSALLAGGLDKADAVLQFYPSSDEALTFDEVIDTLEKVDGVSEVDTFGGTYFDLSNGEQEVEGGLPYASVYPGTASGVEVEITEGNAPSSSTEIILSEELAEEIGASVGTQVQVQGTTSVLGINVDEDANSFTESTFEVSGLFSTQNFAYVYLTGDIEAYVTVEGMMRINPDYMPSFYLVFSDSEDVSEAEQNALAEALRSAMVEQGWIDSDQAADVVTAGEEYREFMLKQINLTTSAMTSVLMIFPVITAAVAMIIVSSTFQVIVKQRQRELALLRCVGATSKQVKRMIVGESAVVGLVGSLLGLVVGVLVGGAILAALGIVTPYVKAISMVTVPSLLITGIVGVVFTVLAGLRPAALAGRARPIEALQKSAVSGLDARKPRIIMGIVSAILLVVSLGFAAYLAAGQDANSSGYLMRFGLIVLACLVGAIASTMFVAAIMPMLTSGIGKFGRGVIWRMSTLNTARNPRRTAATGTAVFIGVALISMMLVGARSVESTATDGLDSNAPLDLVVGNPDQPVLSSDVVSSLQQIEGVSKTVELQGVVTDVLVKSQDGDSFVPYEQVAVVAVDDLSEVVRGDFEPVGDGEIAAITAAYSTEPYEAEVCVSDTCVTLNVVDRQTIQTEMMLAGTMYYMEYLLVSQSTLEMLTSQTQTLGVVMLLEDPDDYQDVLARISDVSDQLSFGGGVAFRASIGSMVSGVLLVVVALLAVSVLVALVGVSNTLSLSVVERTQENGLLRAVGMSKRQMMNMLTVESLVMSIVAVVLGLVFGTVFGVIGVLSLPISSTMSLVIPLSELFIVVVIAVIAAILASILPGLRAARVSPVEALASL